MFLVKFMRILTSHSNIVITSDLTAVTTLFWFLVYPFYLSIGFWYKEVSIVW
jgi:hypothetical protein